MYHVFERSTRLQNEHDGTGEAQRQEWGCVLQDLRAARGARGVCEWGPGMDICQMSILGTEDDVEV